MAGRWQRGDVVVLREVWRARLWAARPLRVVEDRPAQRMFYAPAGGRWMSPTDHAGRWLRLPPDDGRWRLRERARAGGRVLSWAWPDVAHAVLLSGEGDGSTRWYVNLQSPLMPSPVGFDTTDHVLDVLVAPDRSSWWWKDEDEMAEAVRRGLFTREEEDRFRAEGERAARRIVAAEPPFDRDWSGWRPDPTWDVPPKMPPGWDASPG